MAQGSFIFALVFGLIALASAATGPGTCSASCTGYCDLSNNCCTLPSNCAAANCANITSCSKTVCTACNPGYSLDATTKGCCSLTGTGLTGSCTAATCDANGANVKCTTCSGAFYLATGATTCTACTLPARCTSVTSCDNTGVASTCGVCNTGFTKATDGKCCTLPANCATISTCTAADGSAATCTACAAGYVLISNVCTACPANVNCATGQANLKCAAVGGAAGPSTCLNCPTTGTTFTILSTAGECCQADASKNCGTGAGSIKTCATIVNSGTPSVTTGQGTVQCATCAASTVVAFDAGTDGTAYFLDATSGLCTSCTLPTTGYEYDVSCLTWGCTSAVDTTVGCLTCPATGNTALSADKKCGPAITNCEAVTGVAGSPSTVEVVDIVPVGGGARTGILAVSRCGTVAAHKCKPGFALTAGVAITGTAPTSDACTACTVPAANTNCLTGSCTALPSTGFVCLTCAAGFYLNNGVCTAHTVCTAGQYLKTAGTSATNAVCEACASCPTGKTVLTACTLTANTVCVDCKVPCDNCATPTCGGCAACSNNYVFTSTATVCELACGNGNLNDGEQCDETVSGHCTACQCDDGFWPNSDGVCSDIDECAVYTCALNSDENVECTQDEPNTRTCTCLNEKTIRSSTDSSITLEGAAYFNGCNDADLNEEEFLNALADNSDPLDWFLEQLGASGENYEVDEENRILTFTVTFGDAADELTTTELSDAIQQWLFELWGVALADSDVAVVAADGAYGVAVTLSETALDSAATFAPLLSVVAVLLMLIR